MRTREPENKRTERSESSRESAPKIPLNLSELRYRRLFETAQDGILILDAKSGRIIDANPFLLDLLDYPFKSMIGRRLWEIGQFKDVAANEAAFRKLQENEYIRYEDLPLRHKSGKEVQVEFVSNVYSVGSEQVIQCNIRTRSKSLQQCRGEVATLEQANKIKDEQLAVLSHELRTPLMAISCATDLLELSREASASLDQLDTAGECERTWAAVVRRNVGTLTRLVSELLDYTLMAKGHLHLELEKIDVHEVIRLTIENLESQQKGTGVEIESHLHATQRVIRGNAGKLEQVLSNLIGNALKFTARGGLISIVTRNEESGELVIEVSDTGIGIPAEALRQIFQPFEQGDITIHSRFGGLGLGLSIAKALVEAQGGSLEAESAGHNQGSQFRLRFATAYSGSGARPSRQKGGPAKVPEPEEAKV